MYFDSVFLLFWNYDEASRNGDLTIYRFPEDFVQPSIIVWYRIAKFYNNLFTPNKNDQMDYSRKAIGHFQKVTKFFQASLN